MTTTPLTTDLLTRAVRAGLVTAREIAGRDVELRVQSTGQERATLLLHGQPIAYALWRGPRGPRGTDDSADREHRCLQALAPTGLVPGVLGSDAEVVWTTALRGARLTALTGTMAELADVCQSWGAALAALHRAPVGSTADSPIAPRPWVLDPERLPHAMRRLPSGSARAHVLRTLLGDRSLIRTAGRAADRWGSDHWTHGDLTVDRVLVQRAPDLRVRFVDLRTGGLGDPSWDLTGALESIAELTAGASRPWGAASGTCLTDYLLRGYRRAGGPASVDAGTRALRVVARAWESAVALDSSAPHPASMHPAAGRPVEATRLTKRLNLARELAARSARPGLVAA